LFLEKIVGKEAGVPSPSFTEPVFKEQQAYGQTDDCSQDTFNQSVTRQTVDYDSIKFLSESCFRTQSMTDPMPKSAGTLAKDRR